MTRAINITSIRKGQKCIVSELDTNDENILKKLMSMGILPGAEVKIIQTYPTYVLEVGYTQIALDKTIAATICVHAFSQNVDHPADK